MASFSTTVESPWPVERAFAYLADFTHTADWDPGVVASVRLDEGEVGLGSRFEVTTSTAGRQQQLTYEITEFDPPRRFVLVGENTALRSVDTLTFDERDGGSTVTYHADLALRGPSRVADPALHVAFQVIGRQAAAGLRTALEAE